MYCIECGAQIPDNSKYCSHCGKPQNEGEQPPNEQIEEHKKNLDYKFLKKAMGWYLAWVILHLGILLIASEKIFNSYHGAKYFWPFGPKRYSLYGYADFDHPEYYDITEFLVYTIFPLAILIIISLVRSQSKSMTNEE
jgi:hypothetical protein